MGRLPQLEELVVRQEDAASFLLEDGLEFVKGHIDGLLAKDGAAVSLCGESSRGQDGKPADASER